MPATPALIKDLKPNPENPRKVSSQKLKQLKKTLLRFGDLGGIVFNARSKQLVGGHQRASLFPQAVITITRRYPHPTKTGTIAEGFIKLNGERHKYREVAWDKHTERAASIAANNSAGEWDESLLGNWVADLSKGGFDLDLTGFGKDELAPFLKETKEVTFAAPTLKDDKIPAPPKTPVTKLGDCIVLGHHRLICGDSTNLKTVEKLLKGSKVDLVFTDPPYNQPGTGGGYIGKQNVISDLVAHDLNDFQPEAFLKVLTALDSASIYIFGNKGLILDYLPYFHTHKRLWDLLVMSKKNPMPSKSKNWLPDIEWLFFSRKKGAYFNDQLPFENYFRVREITIRPREHGHPTEKQVSFIEPYIAISCPKDGVVLDLFGGSGTTMVACEKQGRRCYMAELEPAYCDVIVQRWEEFTGKKAKRL